MSEQASTGSSTRASVWSVNLGGGDTASRSLDGADAITAACAEADARVGCASAAPRTRLAASSDATGSAQRTDQPRVARDVLHGGPRSSDVSADRARWYRACEQRTRRITVPL